jgi:hypothetical protein
MGTNMWGEIEVRQADGSWRYVDSVDVSRNRDAYSLVGVGADHEQAVTPALVPIAEVEHAVPMHWTTDPATVPFSRHPEDTGPWWDWDYVGTLTLEQLAHVCRVHTAEVQATWPEGRSNWQELLDATSSAAAGGEVRIHLGAAH